MKKYFSYATAICAEISKKSSNIKGFQLRRWCYYTTATPMSLDVTKITNHKISRVGKNNVK